jgi:cytochrome c biogenesis protein CcmG, thiol:disulfide interchange protein DsbE
MRWWLIGGACVVVAVVVLAITRGGSSTPKSAAPSNAAVQKQLAGSPPPLADVHDQANELLEGGTGAFKQRLQALKGYPVFVNVWGSWCGPCRQEFPILQQASVKYGKRVAFLGVDVQDNSASAKRLLSQLPVSYPSFSDPDLKIAAKMSAVGAFPTTVIFDSGGTAVAKHFGPYRSDKEIAADLSKYAR